MKLLVILGLSTFICYPAIAPLEEKPEEKHIYRMITKNNPYLKKEYAQELAEVIKKHSDDYGISPNKLIGILMQESSYRMHVTNKGKDFSIGQINIRNIKYYKLDKNRLMSDVDYSVGATAMMLSDLKVKYGHKEKDYWTRYHSFTPSKRKIYKRLVERYTSL